MAIHHTMTNIPCSIPGCKNEPIILTLIISPDGKLSEPAFCSNHIGNLGMGYLLPNLARFDSRLLGSSYEECRLHAVVFRYAPEEFSVVLKSKETHSVFVFPTGYNEACLIRYAAQQTPFPNPLTHTLIVSIIQALDGSPLEAVLDGYNIATRTFNCHLAIASVNSVVKVKCRISDAVAISLVANMPVRINTAFLGKEIRESKNEGEK